VLNCHGLTLTHLDGPAHTFWQSSADRPRTMYNGFPAALVTTREGCTVGDVALASAGIVSRGVLLDIARLKGVDWLEPRTPIFPDDLEEAEAAQGVRVEPGDILCINTGHAKRKRHVGWNTDKVVEQAGPDAACLPWFKERDIALLACDTANDWFPPEPGMPPRPVHGVGMSSLGLWLIDGADYEELSEVCARLGRWEFLYVISPLRLETATASPVNPIAIL
jgi:kynurenine formamidase